MFILIDKIEKAHNIQDNKENIINMSTNHFWRENIMKRKEKLKGQIIKVKSIFTEISNITILVYVPKDILNNQV